MKKTQDSGGEDLTFKNTSGGSKNKIIMTLTVLKNTKKDSQEDLEDFRLR